MINTVIIFGIGLVLGVLTGWFIASKQKRTFREFVSEDLSFTKAARAAVAERTSKRLDKIMSTVERDGRITNDGVEELFCISNRTASTYLSKLKKAGRLQRQGSGRGTYYTQLK